MVDPRIIRIYNHLLRGNMENYFEDDICSNNKVSVIPSVKVEIFDDHVSVCLQALYKYGWGDHYQTWETIEIEMR